MQVGLRTAQPPHAGVAAGDDCHERLVDLVRDRGGEFAQRRHARGVRQFGLGQQQRVLGLFAVGVVHHEDQHGPRDIVGGREGDGEQHRHAAAVRAHDFGFAFVEGVSLHESQQRPRVHAVVVAQDVVDGIHALRRMPPADHGQERGVHVVDLREPSGVIDEFRMARQMGGKGRAIHQPHCRQFCADGAPVFLDHANAARVEHAPVASFTADQRRVGCLAVRDVPVRFHDAGHSTVMVALKDPAAFQDEGGARPSLLFERAVPAAGRQELGLDGVAAIGVARVQQVVGDASDRCARRPPIGLFGGPVPESDDALLVAHEDHVVRQVEQPGLRGQLAGGALVLQRQQRGDADGRQADQRAGGGRAHVIQPVRIQVRRDREHDAGGGCDDDVRAPRGPRRQQHDHHIQHRHGAVETGEGVHHEDGQRKQQRGQAEHQLHSARVWCLRRMGVFLLGRLVRGAAD